MATLENGYEMIDEFISQDQLKTIIQDISTVALSTKTSGIRNAEKKFASIKDLANSEQLKHQTKHYLSSPTHLVRAILFNKTAENNWLVSWHQDKTVAVSEKFKQEGWEPWSIKDGIHHVQPPIDVLNQMVTFRIHLDDSHQDNGCLKVLPQSHKLGILNQTAIQIYVQKHKPISCEAAERSALVMRPHLLHSSSKASKPSQRRVLHLEGLSVN